MASEVASLCGRSSWRVMALVLHVECSSDGDAEEEEKRKPRFYQLKPRREGKHH